MAAVHTGKNDQRQAVSGRSRSLPPQRIRNPVTDPSTRENHARMSATRDAWLMEEAEEDLSDEEDEVSKESLRRTIAMLTDNVSTLENRVSLMAKQLARQSMELPPAVCEKNERVAPENTFLSTLGEGSMLNPLSENFDYAAWIKNLLAIGSGNSGVGGKQRSISLVFRNLGIHGLRSPSSYQSTVYTSLVSLGDAFRRFGGSGQDRIQILRGFDGRIKSGEMILVLGRPGSGCSTFLKTIAGEMNGIHFDSGSRMNYQGISAEQMRTQFRGEAIYTAEQDVHFPQLTVSQTLSFAARARVPQNRISEVSRDQYAEHMRDVVMAIFGLTQCANTKIGNDLIRGVSGGERKRVSIAEATLSGSPLQCWDNSTRGLDAANAVEFCKNLRIQSDLFSRSACVALYQAPEAAYKLFDKVTLLYEGQQIFFGRIQEAKSFFTDLGFICRDRQTTPDFLTALTNPVERIVKQGYEQLVPQTADDFVRVWKNSNAYRRMMRNIHAYESCYPIGGESASKFGQLRRDEQSNGQRASSPYTISIPMQISLCLNRGFDRARADVGIIVTSAVCQVILSLLVGSVFYNLSENTAGLFSRSAVLFFATLLNAVQSLVEILIIYAQRPIVEKHARYALYHPFAEAASAIICDFPFKVLIALFFNVPLYFLSNLRREPGAFFVFYLFMVLTTLVMSLLVRSIGSMSKTLAQAIAPSAILNLGLIIYTGFPIPVTDMLGWSRWMNYINPLAYTFEALMINELSGRNFPCSTYLPSGPNYTAPGPNSICVTIGSVPGQSSISGDTYLNLTYEYSSDHIWRNFGILIAFMVVFYCTYLLATEYVTEEISRGEVLSFRRKQEAPIYATPSSPMGGCPRFPNMTNKTLSTKGDTAQIQRHQSVIHWQDISYKIKMGKEEKQILSHIDGWVKPGTCTALMGASGAGKTTLLDVLAARVRVGIVSGNILVDGAQRDSTFQRKTGYVQQADIHIATSTVREALRFSAVLRQPSHIPLHERVAYIDEVLRIMDMELYADAIIGEPGEGLNIEQRKRLTIALELAAKPQLLVLLDEPTSGLDSQTAWSIMNLLDTLKSHGQAILCTIHQPSAMIFERFDRLLLLANGQTVYFGEIGTNGRHVTRYFEKNGAIACPPQTNPAEWMLEVIGAAPGTKTDIQWNEVWQSCEECSHVREHLDQLASVLPQHANCSSTIEADRYDEFAVPFTHQARECTWRIFAHYWRTPSYIYSKLTLTVISALYIGFSYFRSDNSQQGVQDQILSIFMLLTIFQSFTAQTLPAFVSQRGIFEARERPAKVYSWQAFMVANITVELAWNSLAAVFMFLCWYYPIGFFRNAVPTGAVAERGALTFLLIWVYMLFATTFALMLIAGIEHAEIATFISSMLFILSLVFCGVLVPPDALPGFWVFMYRVSPFTYLASSLVSSTVGNTNVNCSDAELLRIPPPANSTCESYLRPFLQAAGGYIQNPGAKSDCLVCPVSTTNALIEQFGIRYEDRWRDFGLILVYIIFNAGMALGAYWLARVPRQNNKKPATKETPERPDLSMHGSDGMNYGFTGLKYGMGGMSRVSLATSSSSLTYGEEKPQSKSRRSLKSERMEQPLPSVPEPSKASSQASETVVRNEAWPQPSPESNGRSDVSAAALLSSVARARSTTVVPPPAPSARTPPHRIARRPISDALASDVRHSGSGMGKVVKHSYRSRSTIERGKVAVHATSPLGGGNIDAAHGAAGAGGWF